MKRKMKKYMKDGLIIAGTGIGLSIGSSVASDLGATETASALGKVSGVMPVVGGIYAAGIAMDGVDYLHKKTKRKMRW